MHLTPIQPMSPGASRAMSLRIAYDARLSLGRYRGMGRYLRQLIAGREQRLLGLCATGEADPALRLIASGFHPYPLWEQISIPRLVHRHQVDILLAPYNTAPLRLPRSTRLVLVVHDLIFMDPLPFSRSLYQNAGRFYRRFVVPRVVPRAELILTVSNYTSQQLQSRFKLDPSRIRVIPVSLDEEWYAALPAYAAASPYVLAVAGEAPSKNLARALDAFALCRRHTHDPALRMKVAGVRPAFHPAFQALVGRLGIADVVDFLPYLPVAEMRILYQQAQVCFMPSLSEGFGIPVLEAMASGTPVAASAVTSLPEVGGDAALYFDPTSTESMASTLKKIVSEPAIAADLSRRGRIQARRFHPDAVRELIRSFWAELDPAHELA